MVSAAHKARHREAVRAADAEYRESHRKVIRAKSRTNYVLNRDQILAATREDRSRRPDAYAATLARWAVNNKDTKNAKQRRRTARARSAPGHRVTSAQRIEVLSGSFGICAYCAERKVLGIDHIDPIALGGEHDLGNLTASCVSCNASKGALSLLVWLTRLAHRRRPNAIATQ